MQIYISHSRADRELARRLMQQLTAQLNGSEFTVWDPDTSILPGDNWAAITGQALESSELMVVLFTRHAKDSRDLQSDIQYALTSGNYRGRVIPVVVGFVTLTAGDDVPWILLSLDPIYLQDKSPRDFSPVVERIQSLASSDCNAAN